MTVQPVTRTRCPDCGKMAGRLVRRKNGKDPTYERADGTAFYSCPWDDCDREDFAVRGDGVVCDVNLKPLKRKGQVHLGDE